MFEQVLSVSQEGKNVWGKNGRFLAFVHGYLSSSCMSAGLSHV